jgi:tetratricopeptide (TPR) repeat protein
MFTRIRWFLPVVVRTLDVRSRHAQRAANFLLPICFVALAAGYAWGAGNGQEDLDKAADIKINADTISDLSEVIRLVEGALKKGLDKESTEFANKLLASTLLQRAQETARHLFTGLKSADDFRQKREFALSDLTRAIKLDPKQPDAYLLLARLNVLPGGDVKLAREAIGKAMQLGLDDPPTRAKALLLRASLEEQPEKKLADLNEALRLAPSDTAALRTRGLLLTDMDKPELALADLNKMIELTPEDGPLYEAKAIVLARLKKFDQAMAAIDKARKLRPDSIMPLLQRARINASQDNLKAALADLDQALSMMPDNVTALLMRASIYQSQGNKGKAMVDVDRVMKLKPDLPDAIRTRALLLADDRRFDEAIGELERLRKLSPKDPLTLMQLGLLYSVQKQTAKTIDAYTALLAESPKEWQALRGRGDAYLSDGRQAEAIADYENAIKLKPKDYGIINNLAWVLATSPNDKLRNGRRARELATQACQVTEYKLAYILSTLAAAYAEMGDFETAVKWSTKAVELSGKAERDSLKKELESYRAKKPWREAATEGEPPQKSGGKPKAKP